MDKYIDKIQDINKWSKSNGYLVYFNIFLSGMEKQEEEEKHLQEILTAQVCNCFTVLKTFGDKIKKILIMIEVPKILYFLQYKEKMLHVPLQFIIIIRVFLSKNMIM